MKEKGDCKMFDAWSLLQVKTNKQRESEEIDREIER
jgi:hypothetical protein